MFCAYLKARGCYNVLIWMCVSTHPSDRILITVKLGNEFQGGRFKNNTKRYIRTQSAKQ